jgi:hypothetical protein
MISILLSAAVAAAPTLEAPRGAPVMLDGAIGEAEWHDAVSLPLTGGFVLFAKVAGDDVLLAVRFPEPRAAGVDLFADTPGGSLINLHASGQIGQRVPQGDGWTEWNWGNNIGWDSHITHRAADGRSFVPQQGREFRISRSTLNGPEFRLRVGVHAERQLAWPEGSTQRDPAGWARIRLPRL